MSSTIDNIDFCINNKINNLKNILNIFNNYELDLYDQADISRSLDEINNIDNFYTLTSVNLLTEYYLLNRIDCKLDNKLDEKIDNNLDNKLNNKLDEKIDNKLDEKIDNKLDENRDNKLDENRDNKLDENREKYLLYIKFINKENFLGKLNRIYNKCLRVNKNYIVNDIKLKQYFNNFNKLNININYEEKTNLKCNSCNSEMIISTRISEKICNSCGFTEPLFGVISSEEQVYGGNNEAQKQKHGKYDPTKHCKYWLDCIQAEEKKEIPDKIIKKLLFRIKQDSQIISNISCEMYRKYLKDIGQTRYNDHVPLIRKKISGISPPQLTDTEKKLVSMYFTKIVHIFNRIKPDIQSNNKSNCPYHPYFIYKIIEHLLKDQTQKIKRKEILSCIHLQSRETLIDNDNIMLLICKYIPEITYKPTIY